MNKLDLDRKVEVNKKMVGKNVWVIEGRYTWMGEVVDVKDAETFFVKDVNKEIKEVNIFDIRDLNFIH